MSDQPLNPFISPTSVLENLHLSNIFSLEKGVWWILYAVCFYWVAYTLVASYHWFRYSHASWLTVPAIALHLAISYILIVYALTGAFLIPFVL